MSTGFQKEDLLEEYACLPEYLHETKEAVGWLCDVIIHIRTKQCGREEIAWLLGVPVSAFSEQLPSSAAPDLIGTSLLDLGFLPRRSACIIQNSRSAAYLNGRKCTLCRDLKDGLDQHALVLVEGGPGEERSEETAELRKPLMIARKNLEFTCEPDGSEAAGFPSLSLEPEVEPEQNMSWVPSEMLGEAWQEPDAMPKHLQSADALVWLASFVGRLVVSKSCGREEMRHLLNLPQASFPEGFGGSGVPASITEDHAGSIFQDLGFVPEGTTCHVEGCNTNAHLNGQTGKLCEACPEGHEYAKVNLGDLGEMQMHRKNLRLPGLQKTDVSDKSLAKSIPEGGKADATEDGEKSKDEKKADAPAAFFSWFPSFEGLWCGGASYRECCVQGKASTLAVVQDDSQSYAAHDTDTVQSDLHPSFGPSATSEDSSLADKLRKLAQFKVAGNITESEFQTLKERLLGNEADNGLSEALGQLADFKSNGLITATDFEAAKRKVFTPQANIKPILAELTQLLSLRSEGFLTEAEMATAKKKLLSTPA